MSAAHRERIFSNRISVRGYSPKLRLQRCDPARQRLGGGGPARGKDKPSKPRLRPGCIAGRKDEAARRRLPTLDSSTLKWLVLLQRSVDRVKLGVQVTAKAVDRNDDGNRNARCDQAVFNGGCATFIGKEICK